MLAERHNLKINVNEEKIQLLSTKAHIEKNWENELKVNYNYLFIIRWPV